MSLPAVRLKFFTFAALTALASALTCGPITINNDQPDPSENFDLAARQAEVIANGGVYLLLNPGDAAFLRIDDAASPIYGAAISIPASATSALPQALLSLEPYKGVALSTAGSQVIVGHAIETALVDAARGGPLSLPANLGLIRAPYSLEGFTLPLTAAEVYLGRSISEFAAGLTEVPSRSFADDPSTVAGLVAKLGLFVAFHSGKYDGDLIDDDDAPPPPPDPSDQLYFVSFGASCGKNGAADSGIASSFKYEVLGANLSRLIFAAHNGVTEVIRYQVDTTQAVIAPPANATVDPGFPSGVAAFAFAIRCTVDENIFEVTAANDLVTSVDQLAAAGVIVRSVQISAWYQNPNIPPQPIDCGLPPNGCQRLSGKVRFRMGTPASEISGLRINDGSEDGQAGIDTYLSASWDVPL